MIQGSEEWFSARLGKATASKIRDIMAKGAGKTRAKYMGDLIAERLSGQPTPSYSSAAMEWGTETESQARECYEFFKGVEVVQVGFIDHPNIPMAGASPDGLVGDDGLIEIKCPNTATHIIYRIKGEAPRDYLYQMQWQMACTGRKWCDFYSFDPRLSLEYREFYVRVPRDDEAIAKIEAEVIKFQEEIEETIKALEATR